MRSINFGGFKYYYAYQIYVTEPCLIRKANGIYPGCTRLVSIAGTPLENTATYFSAKDAKAALQRYRSIIREGELVNAPRGFAYVIEYYAQLLIVDEECTPYNQEEERIYAEMEDSNIRQKKPPDKNNTTKRKSSLS